MTETPEQDPAVPVADTFQHFCSEPNATSLNHTQGFAGMVVPLTKFLMKALNASTPIHTPKQERHHRPSTAVLKSDDRDATMLLLLLRIAVTTSVVGANANLNPCFSGRPLMGNPCLKQGSNFSKLKYCDATAPLEERIADAVSHMSLAEKISALGTVWPATYSLGLDCYNWYTEATSGVAWAHCGACKTTKFAFPITLAQSFNRTLWQLWRSGKLVLWSHY